ncbi:MAG: relaxase/mobilization nuclease domain-containing protein [Rikenellaceae bacterium]
MIAKNIKSQSFGGSVGYVLKKDAEVLKAEGVMAMSKEDMITSFELQRSVRPEIKSPAGHIPISFAPEDRERMTNEFMVKLAEEYMQNMGIKDTQYIIVCHHDGDNEHVHIIYNRINNSEKLITDKNDYKRNVATCKRLKDKYNLTYGANKFRVKREKLRGSERVKHDIYHAVREEIVKCRTMAELRERLTNRSIEMEYKFRRGSMDIQGLSFTKDNCTFKGSQIDRNFSYKGMQIMFKAIEEEWKKINESQQKKTLIVKDVRLSQQQHNNLLAGKKIWIDGMTMNSGLRHSGFAKLSDDGKMIHFSNRKIPIALGGVKLSIEQRLDLDDGKTIFLSGVVSRDNKVYDCYVKYSDEKQGLNYYHRNPDEPEQQQSQPQQPPQPPPHSQEHNHDQSSSFVSGGLGLFDLPSGSGTDIDDIESEQMARNLKPKKKRGRGI